MNKHYYLVESSMQYNYITILATRPFHNATIVEIQCFEEASKRHIAFIVNRAISGYAFYNQIEIMQF